MSESLFDIFGDHLTGQAIKNVSRQPFSNVENLGKTVSTGPIKPNEPLKKIGETKKSFLSNTGKALRSTPARKVFTPKANVNVGALIYTDDNVKGEKGCKFEDFEFTKPSLKYDNYHRDLFDYLPLPELEINKCVSPPATPPPVIRQDSFELDYSYHDEFFTDDFSCGSIQDDVVDLHLPILY